MAKRVAYNNYCYEERKHTRSLNITWKVNMTMSDKYSQAFLLILISIEYGKLPYSFSKMELIK